MADAKIIDGKAIAEMLSNRIASEVATLKAAHNLQPGIAVVLIGDDPASRIYVRRKTKQAAVAGIRAIDHVFGEDVQQDEILTLIENFNANGSIHGILVQLPLPRHIEARTVLRAISPAKDVDGFHPYNRGLLAEGLVQEALVPCTPFGCLMMLRQVLGDLSGREAVIVGRSNIVGKPMAQLLLDGNSTVTVCHSRTADIQDHCRRADIMVAAVGLPELIRGNWLKPGCTVIDVGINRLQDGSGKARIVGDVAFTEAVKVAGAITPVPGGVGPMTIACLLANTVTASCQQKGIRAPNWLG